MYKVIEDNQSEFFLEPIPKWITHFGFGLMVIIFFILLLATSYLHYPETLTLSITIQTNKDVIATVGFDAYEKIEDNMEIKISSPFSSSPILGKINKKKSWVTGKSLFLYVDVLKDSIDTIPLKGEVITKGEIVLKNSTLLQKILGK